MSHIDVPSVDGRRKQVVGRGFKTAEAAAAARDALLAEIDGGFMPTAKSDTVQAFRDAWIAALDAEGLEPSTVKHYADSTARLMPTIGTKALARCHRARSRCDIRAAA